MSGSGIGRRDFMHGAAVVAGAVAAGRELGATATGLPKLPVDFGRCPRTLESFLQYIVQRRAAEGLNGLVDAGDPRLANNTGKRKFEVGTIYGCSPEDADLAWTAAAAYRYP